MNRTFKNSQELKEYLKDNSNFEGSIWHVVFKITNTVLSCGSIKKLATDEIKEFIKFQQDLVCSDKTHYEKLDDWLEPSYQFVRGKLKKYGAINGKCENKNPFANVWLEIYSAINNVVKSPSLKTEVEYHHSSAEARRDALVKDLLTVIKCVEKVSECEGKASIISLTQTLIDRGFNGKEVSNAFIALIIVQSVYLDTERWGKRCIQLEFDVFEAKKELERYRSCNFSFLNNVYSGTTTEEHIQSLIDSESTSSELHDFVYNLDLACMIRLGVYDTAEKYLNLEKLFSLFEADDKLCKDMLFCLNEGTIAKYAMSQEDWLRLEFEQDRIRSLRLALMTYEKYQE